MFAKKRGVIVVAAVLVTCALLFCTATPAVEAKAPTSLTISAPTSAQVKQSFSITGKLTANGAPLTKRLSLQRLNGNTWITLASQTTTGTYSFIRNETAANTYKYRTTYAGSALYVSSTSPTVTVNIKPTPTPTPTAKTTVKQATTTPTPTLVPPPTPTPSAVVSTGNATALGAVTVVQGQNFTIQLQSNPSSGYHWEPQFDSSALSLVDSMFISSPNPHNLVGVPGSQNFTFQGINQGTSIITFNNISPSNQTANSLTATVTVTAAVPTPTPTPTTTPTPTPTPAPTTITVTASTTTPAVNQPFTLSGTLTAGTTPLSGKTITLLRADPSGTWGAAGTATTAANGAYAFTRSESSQGVYNYYVYFAGDGTHSTATSNTVTVTVSSSS